MPKYGSLYQSSGHTIKEFYKISLSTINVRCIIPSFTDLLFPILGAFVLFLAHPTDKSAWHIVLFSI